MISRRSFLQLVGSSVGTTVLMPTASLTPSKPWSFAIVGDTHVPKSDTFAKIVPHLIAANVKVVVFPGDLVQSGKGQNAKGLRTELETWKTVAQPLVDAGIEIIAIRGNHEADVRGNGAQAWQRFWKQDLNIVKRYNNVTFIGLDNYITDPHTVDIPWLKTAMAQAKGTIIVPFGHEPAFTCGTFHPQCLDATREQRDALFTLLTDAHVPYYFCGHAHQYNIATIKKEGKTLTQIVAGGGGGPLQRKRGENCDEGYQVVSKEVRSENGYLIVTVSDKGLSPVWHKLN